MIQIFDCPRGHVTERHFTLSEAVRKTKLPAWIKCPYHKGTTHSSDCALWHVCGVRAKRRTVYRVGVGGDLPTRGAF